jgi:hypothetical protein
MPREPKTPAATLHDRLELELAQLRRRLITTWLVGGFVVAMLLVALYSLRSHVEQIERQVLEMRLELDSRGLQK